MKIFQNLLFSVFSYHVVLASVPNERFDKQDQTVENGTSVTFEGLRPDTEYKVRTSVKIYGPVKYTVLCNTAYMAQY